MDESPYYAIELQRYCHYYNLVCILQRRHAFTPRVKRHRKFVLLTRRATKVTSKFHAGRISSGAGLIFRLQL